MVSESARGDDAGEKAPDGALDDKVAVAINYGNGIKVARIVVKSPDNKFWTNYIAFVPSDEFERIVPGLRATMDVVDYLNSLKFVSFDNAKYFFASRLDNQLDGVKLSHGIQRAGDVFAEYPCRYELPQKVRLGYGQLDLMVVPTAKLEKELVMPYTIKA